MHYSYLAKSQTKIESLSSCERYQTLQQMISWKYGPTPSPFGKSLFISIVIPTQFSVQMGICLEWIENWTLVLASFLTRFKLFWPKMVIVKKKRKTPCSSVAKKAAQIATYRKPYFSIHSHSILKKSQNAKIFCYQKFGNSLKEPT